MKVERLLNVAIYMSVLRIEASECEFHDDIKPYFGRLFETVQI